MSDERRFPLQWPEGWSRTPASRRKRSQFRKTFNESRILLEEEIRRLGGSYVAISTNLPLRLDGAPYSNARTDDPGVAVYFQWRGRPYALACDTYTALHENTRALAKTIEAMRTIERHGASQLIERAVSGFRALGPGEAHAPEPEPTRPWWEVLGVPAIGDVSAQEIANDPEHPMRKPLLAFLEAQYNVRVVGYHPDRNPEHASKMTELNLARDEARRALSRKGS